MDGWSEEVKETLEDVFTDLERLMYEVRNCVRGAYTHANTNSELADYIGSIVADLDSAAECLSDCEDNSTWESDEE